MDEFITLVKVSKSVYCRIGKNGDSNNGFIICDECCIAVDTHTSPDQARKDLEDMRQVTDLSVKFLINTHYHADHTLGNMYFSEIIASTQCYENLRNHIPFYMKYIEEDKENEERFRDFFIKLPTITFSGELFLFENPDIVITHCGGHTEGSITVYVPEERILFSGDVLFAGYHPYLGDADIPQLIDALTRLYSLDAVKIVPGHGELCSKKEIEIQIRYLEAFYSNLKDLKRKYSKEEILNNVDLLELPEMGKRERIARNVEAQYHKV